MKLAELEALFFRAARGRASLAELDAQFVGRAARTGAGRMRIYNGAYFARLEAALGESFPATRRVLGERRFVELARRCIARFPSTRPALEFAGEPFPGSLERDVAAEERVAVAVARLEWARIEALTAPDGALVQRLGDVELDPVRLRFHWTPSLRLCPSTLAAWRAFQTLDAERSSAACELVVALWRRRHAVEYRTLEPLEAAVLAGAGRSIDLLTVCERLADIAPDPTEAAFRMVSRWLAQGWVARVDEAASGRDVSAEEVER